jgi:hypothetical protein
VSEIFIPQNIYILLFSSQFHHSDRNDPWDNPCTHNPVVHFPKMDSQLDKQEHRVLAVGNKIPKLLLAFFEIRGIRQKEKVTQSLSWNIRILNTKIRVLFIFASIHPSHSLNQGSIFKVRTNKIHNKKASLLSPNISCSKLAYLFPKA